MAFDVNAIGKYSPALSAADLVRQPLPSPVESMQGVSQAAQADNAFSRAPVKELGTGDRVRFLPNKVVLLFCEESKSFDAEPLEASPDQAEVELQNMLGEGSFGRVFLGMMTAGQSSQMVQVAVKINKIIQDDPFMQAEYLSQLTHEACLLQKIGQVNTDDMWPFVKFLGARELPDGHLCLVEALCDSDLVGALRDNLFSTSAKMRNLAYQLLRGLYFLEFNKIVHCDLNPKNILVQQGGPEDHIKVRISDFGSSKKLPYTPQFSGYYVTRWYRPPDVVLKQPINCSWDWWSFGVSLYEVCTRRILFPAESSAVLLTMHYELLGPAKSSFVFSSGDGFEFFSKALNADAKHALRRDKVVRTSLKNRAERYAGQRESVQRWEDGSEEDANIRRDFFSLMDGVFSWDQAQRTPPSAMLEHPVFKKSLHKK